MTRSIRFDDWVWNPNTLELRCGSHVATLEPRVAQLLEFLIAHPGELLSHDRLVDAVWDGRVVSDEAVRRAVFSLRQALAGGEGAENYIRTVHKKGYVAEFPEHRAANPEAIEGFSTPPASGTATPEAVVATTPAVPLDEGAAPIPTSPRRPGTLAIAGAVALMALVAVVLTRMDLFSEREPATTLSEVPAAAPTTIAVLPFISFRENSDSEFLAEGLAEELLGTLARNPQLRVTSRGSAFQFKGQNRDVRDIGRQLGVRYVLEGSVRRFEERVRINVQLVDTETGSQLWSEAYDRTLADWMAVQQDVAVAVARALQQGDKAVAQSGGTTNVEAHLEVLGARQLLATRSVADAEQAIEHLQRALTLDSNYALAYARLADAILIQADSTTGIKAARPVVAPLLDKALALDPGLGEAYALRSMLTDEPAAAERDLRRGLELNPSYARGYELLANLQAETPEQLDQALASIDSAIALDPLTPGNFHSKALLMMTQGYWPEASALDRRALELNPKFRAAIIQLAMLSGVQGNFAEAVGYGEQAVALDPRAVPLRGPLMMAYLTVGDIDSARAVNTPPSATGQLALLWTEGDTGLAADMIYGGQSGPLGTVAPEMVSQIVLIQALSDRDFPRALALLSGILPFTDSLPPEAFGWRVYAYANLKQLLDASGDNLAAARLQQQIDARMANMELRYPRYALINDQIRATELARGGQMEKACTALENAYTPNPRLYWWVVLSNPAFDDMRSRPCFQALRTRIEAHIAAERERIDAMRRAGEIPNRGQAD